MKQPNWPSFAAGGLLLFTLYHFPEFFQAFWITVVFKIGFLLAAIVLAMVQGWRQMAAFGLVFHKNWGVNLLMGLLTGIAFFLLSEVVAVQSGLEKISSVDPATDILSRLPLILFLTFFPSIAEDILTRGYLFGHLRFRLNKTSFILMSAAFFVLNHIWRLQEGASVLAYLFALGLPLAWALWHTRSLWLTLGLHWGANIAFESVRASVQSDTLYPNAAHWILAVCYVLLFLFLVGMKKIVTVRQRKPRSKVRHSLSV